MKRKVFLISLVTLLLILPFFIHKTESDPEPENTPLRPNTELIYYIDVAYDGVDKNGIEGSNDIKASLYSDQIEVEDTIPEGFIYKGYIEPENTTCEGKLVNGVSYQEDTRKINFSLNTLKAGCKVSIGIKVTSENKDTRVEQYNQAIAKHKNEFTTSNSIHTQLGEGNEVYHVNFILQGIENYDKNILQTKQYAKGQLVTLITPPTNREEQFTHYSSEDVEIQNNQFIMPDKDITITLHFTKKENHTLSFNLEGESPINYELPSPIISYSGEKIQLNDLQEGDKVNGFIFNGWQSEVEIIDNNLIMPDKDIVLTGSFTKELFNVCYKISYNNDLINCEQYKEGDIVKRKNIEIDENYSLIGYSQEETFLMPKKDVIVFVVTSPKVKLANTSITLIEQDNKYHDIGDNISLGFILENNGPSINEVLIKIEDKVKLENLILKSCQIGTTTCEEIPYEKYGNYIKIDRINQNTILTSNKDFLSYIIKEEDMRQKTSIQAEILSFISDENLVPNATKNASLHINTKTPLKICNQDSNTVFDQTFQIHITNKTSDYWVILSGNSCKTIYLPESTYNVEQLIPQEYQLTGVNGDLDRNKSSLWLEEGKSYNISFENTYRKIGYYHTTGKIINKIKE